MSRTAASTDLQREWNVLKARQNPHLEDKSGVLDARDRIQRLRLKSEQKGFNDDEVVIQGTCLEMCPEKERYERLKQNRVDTWEENGHFIKDFSRQAADQDMPLPSELRTEATLRSTMDYLLREIIVRPPENPENPAGWYDFVWRRLRAIRKEITQQRLTGAVIASILEDMCRFHLVSCHMFCEADHNQFDQKFNLEAVNDCLATLSRIYAEMEEEKIYSENIAEMRSYEMLLRIWTDKLDLVKITSLMLQLPEHIQAQSELAFARKVVSACNSRLYSEYISLLRQADYVTACLMHYYLPMVQARTLHHLAVSSGGRSKGSTSLPMEFVQSTFGLNTQEELQIFCAHHGLESKEGEPSMVSFNAGSVGRRDPKTYPRVRSIEYVESKTGARNMAEIIARKQFMEIAVPRIVEVHSFDENDVYSGEDPWSSRISNIENIPPPKNTQPVGFFQNLYQTFEILVSGVKITASEVVSLPGCLVQRIRCVRLIFRKSGSRDSLKHSPSKLCKLTYHTFASIYPGGLDLLTLQMASASNFVASNVCQGRTQSRLSFKEKKKILELYPAKMTLKEVMKHFGVRSETTIHRIQRQRDVILALPSTVRGKILTCRKRKFDEIEEAVMLFHQKSITKGFPVSRTDIQLEARSVAKKKKVSNFRGSDGWVTDVFSRNELQTVNLQGEEVGADPEVAEKWIKDVIPDIIQNYRNADIFNCDETATYFRATPRKTLLKKGKKMKGCKKASERLSVMFCCSAAGEKLAPVIIGKSKKPRAFSKAKLDLKKAGFVWANNTNAWMTKRIFEPWLKQVNERMKSQNRRILLFLDNASGHKVDSLSHVKLVFLPPNQTSRIQPLDQGIIKSYKSHEDALKAEHRRENSEKFTSIHEYKKSLNVLDSVKWIMKSWSEVTGKTIRNCFQEAGCFHSVENRI